MTGFCTGRGRFQTCPYPSLQDLGRPLRGRFAATRPPRFAKGQEYLLVGVAAVVEGDDGIV